jgi:hypothetical protein
VRAIQNNQKSDEFSLMFFVDIADDGNTCSVTGTWDEDAGVENFSGVLQLLDD